MPGRCTGSGAVLTGFSRTSTTRPSSAGARSVSRLPAVAPDGRHPRALSSHLSVLQSDGSEQCPPVIIAMATTSSSSELMARLLPSIPFPFSSNSLTTVCSKQLSRERQALAEIKQETSSTYAFATPDRRPSFHFESLATEFETAEENDSGIG